MNANELAFPGSTAHDYKAGLTKREVFVLGAMMGFCAHPESGNAKPEKISELAIEQADALLAALEKKP